MQATSSKRRFSLVLETMVVAVVYWALARLGQFVAIAPGNVTPVWPASGFALAVVMMRGYRTWLGIWIGIAFATVWPFLDLSTLGDGLRTIAIGIAAGPGAILQAFAGSYLIKTFCANRELFGQTRDVFFFTWTQAVACFSSATFGVLAMCVGQVLPWPDFGYTWITWYFGDAVGVLLVAPFLLTARHIIDTLRQDWRTLESVLILSLSVVATLIAFGNFVDVPLSFLPLPLVLWAAVRGGPFAVSATVLAVTAVAVYRTSTGQGPFVSDDPNASLLSLQVFTAITAITGLAVSAALSEHQIAEQGLRDTMTELQQSEARYFELFENANDLVFTVNLDGRFTSINKLTEEVTGFRRAELLGEDISSIVPTEYAYKVRTMIDRKLTTHEGTTYEIEIVAKNGRRVPIEISSRLIIENGEPVASQGIARDISDRKQAEQVLRDSEALYSSLVETLPLNVLRKDIEGRITFANKMFCELTGKPPAELLGKTDLDLYPLELAEKYRKDDQRVIETGKIIDDIEQHVADGKSSYFRVIRMPLIDSAGHIQGTQAVFWDVTERIKAQQEIARYTNELEQSNRDLEQFAYVASHDLQEPLRSIAGYAQLLHVRLRDKLDDDTREFLTYLSDAAKRMQRLIHGLLDYSRVGRERHLFEPTNLETLLDAKLHDLGAAIRECDAAITRDPLPTVTADPVQLGQLFQNLINNAIKYRGERRPEVHIGVERNEEVWTFSVRDNGIGIPQEHFERIFVIFQRLHARNEFPGLGIGLSLAKRIVDRHGGRIWVESQTGQGSTFFFTLPVRPAARPQ